MQDFRAFTLKADGLLAVLTSPVQVFPAFPADSKVQIPGVGATAVWDTGASGSVISAELVSKLHLAPVGVTEVNHAAGRSTHPTHLVNFGLPNGMGVAGLLVSESPKFNGFDVLIGMDVISQGDFAVTNVAGRTWMSFRTPSLDQIDYVRDAERINNQRTGRNDPCWCGSGEKFKRCHGK